MISPAEFTTLLKTCFGAVEGGDIPRNSDGKEEVAGGRREWMQEWVWTLPCRRGSMVRLCCVGACVCLIMLVCVWDTQSFSQRSFTMAVLSTEVLRWHVSFNLYLSIWAGRKDQPSSMTLPYIKFCSSGFLWMQRVFISAVFYEFSVAWKPTGSFHQCPGATRHVRHNFLTLRRR